MKAERGFASTLVFSSAEVLSVSTPAERKPTSLQVQASHIDKKGQEKLQRGGKRAKGKRKEKGEGEKGSAKVKGL